VRGVWLRIAGARRDHHAPMCVLTRGTDMMGAVIVALATLWLAFNAAFVGIVVVRASRSKKQIRQTSVDRLMAAHFSNARA
jgi:hypothetical protein